MMICRRHYLCTGCERNTMDTPRKKLQTGKHKLIQYNFYLISNNKSTITNNIINNNTTYINNRAKKMVDTTKSRDKNETKPKSKSTNIIITI